MPVCLLVCVGFRLLLKLQINSSLVTAWVCLHSSYDPLLRNSLETTTIVVLPLALSLSPFLARSRLVFFMAFEGFARAFSSISGRRLGLVGFFHPAATAYLRRRGGDTRFWFT